MDNLWTPYEAGAVQQMMTYTFIGGPDTIKRDIDQFAGQHGINELMVVSNIYDHEARLRSFEIVAEKFF